MSKLVRMHVTDASALGDGLHVAVNGALVEGLVVVAFDEQAGVGRSSPGSVVVDEADQQWVQRDRAVVSASASTARVALKYWSATTVSAMRT